jgi:hypothetical protein
MSDNFVLVNIDKNLHNLAPKFKSELANEIDLEWENVLKNLRDDLIR